LDPLDDYDTNSVFVNQANVKQVGSIFWMRLAQAAA